MTNCALCGINERESYLFDAIFKGSIRKICESCQKREKFPLIKKPTSEQIEQSKKVYSVKEIMNKLSTKKEDQKTESYMNHKNLAKLRFPGKKQEHDDLVYNYDWILKQSRRRMKISSAQLSEKTGVEKEKIELLENGQIYNAFQGDAKKLQEFFGIKILKGISEEYKKTYMKEEIKQKEKQILDSVKNKIESQKKRGIFSRELSEENLDEDLEKVVRHEVIDLEDIKQKKFEESLAKKERMQHDLEEGTYDFSSSSNKDLKLKDIVKG